MPTLFPEYFLAKVLRGSGQPHKIGLLRRQVVDTAVLDVAVGQLVLVAFGLGVEQPHFAIRLLAQALADAGWEWENTEEKIVALDSHPAILAQPHVLPQNIFWGNLFSTAIGKAFPSNGLADPRVVFAYRLPYLQALLWAFLHPQEAGTAWMLAMSESLRSGSPATLVSDPSFWDLKRIITEYEALERMSNPPAQLLAVPAVKLRLAGALPDDEKTRWIPRRTGPPTLALYQDFAEFFASTETVNIVVPRFQDTNSVPEPVTIPTDRFLKLLRLGQTNLVLTLTPMERTLNNGQVQKLLLIRDANRQPDSAEVLGELLNGVLPGFHVVIDSEAVLAKLRH